MTSGNGSTRNEPTARELMNQVDRMQRAMKKAVREAALAHQRAGVPMVIVEDGKIKEISAEEFLRPRKNGRKKRPSRR